MSFGNEVLQAADVGALWAKLYFLLAIDYQVYRFLCLAKGFLQRLGSVNPGGGAGQGVDRVQKRVSLGLKELLPDPWVEAESYYKAGQIVKAKVLRFASFGAFAELDHNLEGLIHISELSKDSVQRPEEAVKIGDEVEVKILRILPEEQRIGLL